MNLSTEFLEIYGHPSRRVKVKLEKEDEDDTINNITTPSISKGQYKKGERRKRKSSAGSIPGEEYQNMNLYPTKPLLIAIICMALRRLRRIPLVAANLVTLCRQGKLRFIYTTSCCRVYPDIL